MLRCLLAFGLLIIARELRAEPHPDVILLHGKVVTVDPQFRVAGALALTGERIVAVGTDHDIQKLGGPNTRVIDLGGKVVIPGLIDSHVHPTGAALYEFDHPVPEMDTIADVLAYVAARTKVVPEGEWILLSQVFITRLRDQRYPTRKELDLVAPRHPVMFATGPDASLNSAGLALNGIDRNYKITDNKPGYIEKDPQTGEPTGILRSCTRIVKTKTTAKSATPEERRTRIKELLASYNSIGITSICDRNASDDAVTMYGELQKRDELTCRVFVNLGVDAQAPLEKIEERIRAAAANPHHAYDNRLWLRGIKVFLDGGMLTGSAYMLRPWGVSPIYSITDPEYRGLLYIQPDRLKAITRLALKHDLQMTAHAVGDGAVQALVDCYDELNAEFPLKEKRPCLTHANFMTAEVIEKMQRLGIVADLQPAWLYLDGQTLLRQFGNERMQYFQPYKTLIEKGVVVGGGSDHMQKIGSLRSVNPYNPFLAMWTTLARMPRGMETPLHPEQCLSREQALRLYTINNAWLTFEEKEKGSLEPGKLADFVVLKQDLLTCPLEDVRSTEVDQTWLGGKCIFSRVASP